MLRVGLAGSDSAQIMKDSAQKGTDRTDLHSQVRMIDQREAVFPKVIAGKHASRIIKPSTIIDKK